MNIASMHAAEVAPRKAWWRESEVAVLIVLVVVAYVMRLGDLSVRGEEPRRAQVAFEMMANGDWIVPREQGEVFRSRAPLQNWLIAASTVACGSREAWAIRFPSVLALLLTALLIYGYSRTCLSRPGALAAAVAFVTFGEVFSIGWQAETEMVFISLVSASLLLWHWGQVQSWPALRTWVIAYVCVGLAVLCKGPQPPVYFLTSVVAYLLLTGQWRRLFSWAHLAGALAGAAVVLSWLIPCLLRTSWPEVWSILMNDTSGRFVQWQAREVALHLLQFPLEILGCTLPWSLLLFGYMSRDLRRALGAARPQVLFLALCVALSFPSCWIPPGGRTRYFSPLYPCMAVLAGVVLECCMRADLREVVRNGWRRYVLVLTGLLGAAAVAMPLAAFLLAGHPKYGAWAEPPAIALGYAAAILVLAALIYRGRHAGAVAPVRTVVLASACALVLIFTGLVTDVRIRRSGNQAADVARVKELLPPGRRLVSIGHIHSAFAYYYALPIDPLPLKATANDLPAGEDVYFCFDSAFGSRPALPFTFQEVAVIPMDRSRQLTPEQAVVIARYTRTTLPPQAKPVSPAQAREPDQEAATAE